MQIAIETVPMTAQGHRDLVEVSYSPASDRMCIVSRTTVEAAEMLLSAALDQVRAMKRPVCAGEASANSGRALCLADFR